MKSVGFGSDSSVDFYIDDKLLKTIYPDESGFYSIYLDTTKYTQSQHKLTAKLSGNGKQVEDIRYISMKGGMIFEA